ncbi:SRPBCC family protein [Lysinibacillus piscis]|uniref:Activator of Hsp90 ATPase homologue 1/2-like C-terminal domain-containing protein n=1 Tax=Lysinibacillus piscis TaxID=2518931 RepID=A0ABQ5NN60_9BACI|nr:SRPBCC family protein [Lysinibacillus sp. KH24]GLC89526.1 hypothetical protein LYSBPC_26530 [Lysinibacillus sp. KH24]
MLATISQQANHSIAQFARPLPYSVDAVWAVLTENDKLQKWMGNLEIIELRKNGKIHFNMNDGTDAFEEIAIIDFIDKEVLAFEWGTDTVRFEVSPTSEGCQLRLIESIHALTEHTAKDLAGWHICLNLLTDLLNGIVHNEFPMDDWQKRYTDYQLLVDNSKA